VSTQKGRALTEAAPDTCVVYADNDPIVLAHARALLTSDPAGATEYIDAEEMAPVRRPHRLAGELPGVSWPSARHLP
jgi:hypothetical protein